MLFPLKVIGRNADNFEGFVDSVVQAHAPHSERTMTTRLSQGGKYVAITVTFVAESRDQLDAIYLELGKHGRVLVAL